MYGTQPFANFSMLFSIKMFTSTKHWIMKNIILLLCLFLSLYSCKQKDTQQETVTYEETEEEINKATLDGVWELVSFYNYDDDKVKDTIFNSANKRQIKMFSNGKIVWTRRAPANKVDYFGYGSYVITDSTLTETLEFGSIAMLKVIDTMHIFTFELIRGKDTFTQIEIGPEGDRIFSENYERIVD